MRETPSRQIQDLPGRLMRSFLAFAANSYYPNKIYSALTSFADECCGTLARLIAYVGMLALLAIVGVHLWDRIPDIADAEPAAPAAPASWSGLASAPCVCRHSARFVR